MWKEISYLISCFLSTYKFVSFLYFTLKCADREKRLYIFNPLVFLSSIVSVHILLNMYLYVPVTNIYLAQPKCHFLKFVPVCEIL